MATNFRLMYNTGIDYNDMFQQTDVEAIIGAENIFNTSEIDVNVPATQDNIQNISITTNSSQVNSVFRVYLNTTGEDALTAYNTITQAQITNNQLTLVRLYDKPTTDISIKLVFYETRGET